MSRISAFLNLIIDAQELHPHLSKNDARLALHAIETQGLAINALRLVAQEKNTKNANEAALDHARKLLDLHDKYVARHSTPAEVIHIDSPSSVGLAAVEKLVSDQDVSDLV